MRLKVRLLFRSWSWHARRIVLLHPKTRLNGSDGQRPARMAEKGLLMTPKHSSDVVLAQLGQEILYVGVGIGKQGHVAGFLSLTLLARHRRFEHCPALSFE